MDLPGRLAGIRMNASLVARRAIALLLVFALALPLWVSAPPEASAATVAQLKAQLEALRKEAAPAGAAYARAADALEDTQFRIKQTDARIKKQTKKLAKSEKTLGLRADSLYRQGGEMGVLDFILGSSSWDDFITRLDYINIIAASDADLVKDVKDTRAALQRDRVKLLSDAKAETKELATAAARKNTMEAALNAKKAQYDRLVASISAQSGGSYPPGPNGQTFPVQGVHFYADTWGAARSGGRHHQGTDIMSPKGTPVVATTAGTANPHYNGLGGKSITLRGDNGWQYYYAHLDRYAISGGRVKAGQLIGYVGNTGNAAGGPNHLHFQMGPGGRWVNPYPYLRAME